MGLFSFFQKKPQAAPEEDAFPDLYTGMRVEVQTPTGVPLFTGRVRLLGAQALEVRAETGGFLPRAVYGQAVRLQGFQENGQSFTLDGSVGPNAPDFWRIERLRLPQANQHREHYRQNTGFDGYLSFTESFKGQKHPCKVLDISAGGARVITKALLQPQGTVYLKVSLLPEDPSFLIPCLVKRVQSHSKPGSSVRKFEYGCQFVDMPLQEQERLTQSIFTLQRTALQARRGQSTI